MAGQNMSGQTMTQWGPMAGTIPPTESVGSRLSFCFLCSPVYFLTSPSGTRSPHEESQLSYDETWGSVELQTVGVGSSSQSIVRRSGREMHGPKGRDCSSCSCARTATFLNDGRRMIRPILPQQPQPSPFLRYSTRRAFNCRKKHFLKAGYKVDCTCNATELQ